jgi:hypothetical protein
VGDISFVIAGGEGKVVDGKAEHGVQVGFVHVCPTLLEDGDLFEDDIEAGDLVPKVCQGDAGVETHITCANK